MPRINIVSSSEPTTNTASCNSVCREREREEDGAVDESVEKEREDSGCV